ncbi:hypothetical protein FRB90_002245 [Tulasnella sp. 427]|nr:hypothetical protein FRB90_002245 [Tulasnella sp. 427]
MSRSAFCSANCSKTAAQSAPSLLAVPSDDPSFTLVANQFANEWKHTATPPTVKYVYRIVLTARLKDPFEKRRSDTYVTQVAQSKYQAMLMTRVLGGNAIKFTVPDPTLVAAPPGYDAIRGVPGSGLLYDELIVYDNDQVRPFYLVIYEK